MNLRTQLDKFESLAAWLQSPLLLLIRLYWGWSFAQTGWGKLMNLDRTAGFFESIDIPMPKVNAFMAGATECFGGLFLLAGLFSRIAAVPLAFTMCVAYATAHREELFALFGNIDEFTEAAPFSFLLASLIVLAFGPGKLSVDHLLARKTESKDS